MKKSFLITILAMVLGVMSTAQATMITYQSNNIAGNTWEYAYTVENDTLGFAIEEFTIFFDLSLYENLTLAIAPSGWDPLVIQPEPSLPDDGFYDALALVSGIAPGEILEGFSVQFDYLGTDMPGSQYFEVVDPFTFDVLDSGNTEMASVMVSEPGMLWLFSCGLIGLSGLARRKKS